MPSFFAKVLTFGALAAPVFAAPSSMVKKSQIINTSAKQPAIDLCGTADNVVLYDTPWIVYNMFYDAAGSVGTQCTRYDHVKTPKTGNRKIVWSSETNIEYVKATDNVPKGYAFVGLTQGLETTIAGIDSIPTAYSWSRTSTSTYKGNVCYDFMTSDTKGDSTSSNAQELMLWLEYEGGQLPIGWGNGAKATIPNLFGTSWKLYEGKNDDTGITVHTMMPDTQFKGSFTGDLKLWLEALVQHGTFKESTYVNVGNAGTEYFYGHSNLNATLGLQINLK